MSRSDSVENRRRRAYTRMYWEKELPLLRTFGLRDGMSVVEFGSGEGIVSDLLLRRLPDIALTSVELREEAVVRARAYLRDRGHEDVRVVQADIQDTGLPDASSEFVYARLVFRYLADPLKVVREAFRILKPGGRLVISDVDHDLWGVFDPPLPELRPVLKAYARRLSEHGGDAYIGRRIPGLLAAGGFNRPKMEAVSVSSRDLPKDLSMETFLAPIGLARIERMVKGGSLPEGEAKAAREGWNRFLESPSSYVMKMILMACGEKATPR